MIINILKEELEAVTDCNIHIQGGEDEINSKPYILIQHTQEFINPLLKVKQLNLTFAIVNKSEEACKQLNDSINTALTTLTSRIDTIDYIQQTSEDYAVQDGDCVLTLGYFLLTK